ncbi:MAG: FHA domain-containing protein [Armatimonadetes bacterium]|nr:FHA domain-containing protein [Armatimonadota bacterium]MBX3110008.1 FHA domain-containing protein [Fimbriimonadaceae bacterium]
MKRAFLLFALLAAALGSAQDLKTFVVTPPGEGGFAYVFSKGDEIKDPVPIEGKFAEAAAPDDPNGWKVWVVDSAINRAAGMDLVAALKAKAFKPKADQFTTVADIEFHVATKSGPFPGGSLVVTGGKDPLVFNIPASDSNVVGAHFLTQGAYKFELKYSAGGEDKSVSGTFEPDKKGGAFVVDVLVPESFKEPVSDQSTAKPAGGTPVQTPSQPRDSGQNPAMAFLRLLVGLAVVGGLGYAGWWYYRNNQTVVEKLADQAGLNRQTGAAPDPTGAMPPEPAKRDIQKINLGSDAAPIAASASPAATPTVKNPRLVTAGGDVFLIPEGTATVGRENSDVVVAAESGASRRHAEISRTGGVVTLTDSGSTNGTYVNGTKIAAPTVIQSGDTIQFGAASYRYEE